MKAKYSELLNKLYEIEGLLLLAMQKDEVPESLKNLIEEKMSGVEWGSPKVAADAVPVEEMKIEEVVEPFYALEDEEETPSVRSAAPKEESHASKRRKLPVFSLNDRFLFLRELFNGDAVKFNGVLKKISTCADYEEAEKFLGADWGMKREGETTDARFLSIIEDYFKG